MRGRSKLVFANIGDDGDEYRVCAVPSQGGDVITVQKIAEGNTEYYTITRTAGHWHCDCPAASFQTPECKHIRAVLRAEVLAVLGFGEGNLKTDDEVKKALEAEFDEAHVKWKPGATSEKNGKKTALGMPYIDARDVMDRLDDVVGPGGWRDSYSILPNGAVVCRLEVKIGGEWVGKEDVGVAEKKGGTADPTKAAYSDALKRAAVKFGIGRYLYRLEPQWGEFDGRKFKGPLKIKTKKGYEDLEEEGAVAHEEPAKPAAVEILPAAPVKKGAAEKVADWKDRAKAAGCREEVVALVDHWLELTLGKNWKESTAVTPEVLRFKGHMAGLEAHLADELGPEWAAAGIDKVREEMGAYIRATS